MVSPWAGKTHYDVSGRRERRNMIQEGRDGRRDAGICGRRGRVTLTPFLSETHAEKREGTVAEGAGGLGVIIVFFGPRRASFNYWQLGSTGSASSC
jgi:hypothetical protein